MSEYDIGKDIADLQLRMRQLEMAVFGREETDKKEDVDEHKEASD